MKNLITLCAFVTLICAFPASALCGPDVAGSKDHPVISRIKGSTILFYKQTKFGKYNLPINAKGDLDFSTPKNIAGKITRIQYSSAKENNPQFIVSNYQTAFKSAGFTILKSITNEELGVGGRSQDWNDKYYGTGGYWNGIGNGRFGMGKNIPNFKINQSFIAASAQIDGTEIFITVYAIDNGSYTLITQDVIEVGSAQVGLVAINKNAKLGAAKSSAPQQNKPDVAGSKDHPVISRIAGSAIEFYEETIWGAYKLPLTDEGTLNFKDPKQLEGKITRIQYSSVKENTPEFILSNYKAAFKAADFTILTALVDEKLGVGGRSQDWRAKYYETGGYWNGINNGKFGMGIHIPNFKTKQCFIAASAQIDGIDIFIIVYAIDNDKYTLITQDVIEVGVADTGLVTVDKIAKGIAAKGHIAIYDIYFDTGKATVKPGSDQALKTIAEYMKSHKQTGFFIVGHTDSTGKLSNNRTLSTNRAKTVMSLLITKFGVAKSQLGADGVASLSPVASNTNEVGRKMNRRVEIVLR